MENTGELEVSEVPEVPEIPEVRGYRGCCQRVVLWSGQGTNVRRFEEFEGDKCPSTTKRVQIDPAAADKC